MTLDEAIQHAQDVADNRTDMCDECRAEHLQLASWLRELKELRERKIYIVEKGIYSDKHIIAATTDKQKALDIVKFFRPRGYDYGDEPEITEYVDGAMDGLLYNNQKAYSVRLNEDGSFDSMREQDMFDIEYYTGPSIEKIRWPEKSCYKYVFRCIAPDENVAIKCAHDAYSQYQAEHSCL